MGDTTEPGPDRSPSARPVRVAGFDDLAGRDPDPEQGRRVADFDGLDVASPNTAPVAALDALGAPAAAEPTDGVSATRAGRRVRGRRVEPEEAIDPGPIDPVPTDDLPPDAPLPRGRRRGARAARLGPDAPDPDEPQPEADPVTVAREICLRLLTDRARTRQELDRALARKGVPAEAAAAVLDRFDEVGLIDDAAFAGQWVRSRHTHRGLGRRAIAVELRRKGVAEDVAREALTEVDGEAEAQRARELVDRKLRSLAVDTADQRIAAGRRLVGMLARKGYGAGTAYRVVREALAEQGADVDELGTEPTD